MSKLEFNVDEYTDHTDYTKRELRLLADHGPDWYLVQYLDTDGRDSDVRHSSALSSVLQCGRDPADYRIARITQCDPDVWGPWAPLRRYSAKFGNKFFWCEYEVIAQGWTTAENYCVDILEELDETAKEEFQEGVWHAKTVHRGEDDPEENVDEADYEYRLLDIRMVEDWLDVEIWETGYTHMRSGGNG